MDSTMIAAAIMAAGFVNAQRQALNAGRLDDSLREKFVEYYQFIQQQTPPPKKKEAEGA
ncbi:MAG: hypothetical protein NTZ98_13330 [Acidobacteria bacterium]|nr:hypothetical protein [Acidobacteriota bacterium]